MFVIDCSDMAILKAKSTLKKTSRTMSLLLNLFLFNYIYIKL